MLQYLEAILFDIKYTVVSLSADAADKMVTVFAEQFRNNSASGQFELLSFVSTLTVVLVQIPLPRWYVICIAYGRDTAIFLLYKPKLWRCFDCKYSAAVLCVLFVNLALTHKKHFKKPSPGTNAPIFSFKGHKG